MIIWLVSLNLDVQFIIVFKFQEGLVYPVFLRCFNEEIVQDNSCSDELVNLFQILF
jgi:hypothetical protein